MTKKLLGRAALPAAVFAVTAAVYAGTLGHRILETSPDDHYSHLAESFLAGQLGVIGNRPDGTNDWACFDEQESMPCPTNRWHFSDERYRWYVSFPPLPGVVMMPFVAIAGGTGVPDRLIWAILAGFGPALLFVLLRFLSESGRSGRSTRENLLLTALFAFGSVFYFTAVQGTVWFAAHVVACGLLPLYVLFGLDARRPAWAGLMLGLVFMCRPTTAFLALFFLVEAMKASRPADAVIDAETFWRRCAEWLRGVRWPVVLKNVALFSAPILVIGAIQMWMNQERFHDPFEFGHAYLQIRWRPRIERWGLFNYHYFPRNLAVFMASLPWLSALPPYVTISRHGLALWFTTPNLLQALWPKKVTVTMVALFAAVIPVVILNLMYQNTGWVQFGYRFGLDYLPLVFALLALNGRRFGPVFIFLALFSVAVNTFGAITFDRAWQFYDADENQTLFFQPD